MSTTIAALNAATALTGTEDLPVDQSGQTRRVRPSQISDYVNNNLPNNVKSLGGLSGVADRLPYFSGIGVLSLATITAFARSILDDADAAAVRATLGLGNTAALTALGTLTPAANKLPYFTGANTAALLDITAGGKGLLALTPAAGQTFPYYPTPTTTGSAALTAAGLALLDDADAAAQRTTLGLKTAAVADIKGAVSQAAGVPTGAIYDTGSNANGVWTKYADGTLKQESLALTFTNISTALGSIFTSAGQTWTFPIAFVGNAPVTDMNQASSFQFWPGVQNNSLTGVALGWLSAVSFTGTLTARAIAWGRWY